MDIFRSWQHLQLLKPLVLLVPTRRIQSHIVRVFTNATETADYVIPRHIWSCWETYSCLHGVLATPVKVRLPRYKSLMPTAHSIAPLYLSETVFHLNTSATE